MNSLKGLKVLILHFRVGLTDGVSLEIGAWKKILERAGAEVKLGAGNVSVGADYVIEHFENQLDTLIYDLDEEAFGGFKNMTQDVFEQKFLATQAFLEGEFDRVLAEYKPDWVVVSNVFSVGENLVSVGALVKALDKARVPTLSVNHDFIWEAPRYRKPSSELVEEQVELYMPPIRPYMRYCTINKIAQAELERRKGIKADLMYDTLDFEQKIEKDVHYWKLLEKQGVKRSDIVILQATRVVRRKNIELAIDLTKLVSEKLSSYKKPVTLYDGRKFDPTKNKVVLVASGYAEKRDEWYLKTLKEYAKEQGVNFVAMNGEYEDKEKGLTPILKMHQFADLVSYPSGYEGFGNQFLEAVFSRKPVVVFEYPVFQTDIKPKGFGVISLGDKASKRQNGLVKVAVRVMRKATVETVAMLTDEKRYRNTTNKNFAIAAANFSYENALTVFKRNLVVGQDVEESTVYTTGE